MSALNQPFTLSAAVLWGFEKNVHPAGCMIIFGALSFFALMTAYSGIFRFGGKFIECSIIQFAVFAGSDLFWFPTYRPLEQLPKIEIT
jgi:hypothetical protein